MINASGELEVTPTPNKVTLDMINAKIAKIDFVDRPCDTTLTLCIITLDNGFSVRGESACVDPNEYNRDTGRLYAESAARSQLWLPMGFLLAEDRHRERQMAALLASMAENNMPYQLCTPATILPTDAK